MLTSKYVLLFNNKTETNLVLYDQLLTVVKPIYRDSIS